MSGRAFAMASFVALLISGCVQLPAAVVFKTPGTGAASVMPQVATRAVMREPPPPATARQAAPSQAPATSRPASVVAQRGDTVYAIARRYNVTVRGLIEANRLKSPYKLRAGQRVVMPRERIHLVRRGDTVYGVSRRYGIDMKELVRANGLFQPYRLTVGGYLRVPLVPNAGGGVTRVAATRSARGNTASRAVDSVPARAVAAVPSPPTRISKPPPRTGSKFLWPVSGKVVSRFGSEGGGRHNDGINILAPRGTPVRAAENGVVAYAGNELQGYGNLVLVRHADGWTTAYAHNDALLVTRGDKVRRGQLIARVGATGSVSTPQAHFELRKGSRAVDPTKHMARN